MADTNHGPKGNLDGEGAELEAGTNSLPANLMHLYVKLAEKGWRQSPTTPNGSDTKTSGQKRRPAPTVEVNHLVLEKPYPQNEVDPEGEGNPGTSLIKKAKVVLRLFEGKIACRMYSEPLVTQFEKKSFKGAKDGDLFVEEIEDYYKDMDLSYRVTTIQEGTKAALRRTSQFVNTGGILVPVDE